MNRHMTLLSFVLVNVLLMPFKAVAANDDATSIIDQAKSAMAAKDYAKAAECYQKARELLPMNAEIAYNLGVAQYRHGDYEQASESLKQAIGLTNDAGLRARAIYNMGNASYTQTLKAMAGQADPAQAAAQMNDAQKTLKEAIENYKKAIDADPTDEDARANAELSHRLLTELQKIQQQQQQQQDQQQNQDQSSPSDSQGQPQSQPQTQPQQNQQRPAQTQPQTQPQPQPQSQPSQENKADQSTKDDRSGQKEQDQEEGRQPESQPAESRPGAESDRGDAKRMSREAAERLLQAVRDKERKRRAELARREAAKYAPAEKDW